MSEMNNSGGGGEAAEASRGSAGALASDGYYIGGPEVEKDIAKIKEQQAGTEVANSGGSGGAGATSGAKAGGDRGTSAGQDAGAESIAEASRGSAGGETAAEPGLGEPAGALASDGYYIGGPEVEKDIAKIKEQQAGTEVANSGGSGRAGATSGAKAGGDRGTSAGQDAGAESIAEASRGSAGGETAAEPGLGEPAGALASDGYYIGGPEVEKDIAKIKERLTDQEQAEHAAKVSAILNDAVNGGLATDKQYTTDPDRVQWTAARNREQGAIVDKLYSRASEVPCDRKAIIVGGLPGAGKTTVLARVANIDRSQYLTISPDDIKEEMARRGLIPAVEGLSPLEASELVHEESSAIARQLEYRVQLDGKNVIFDVTMSSMGSTEKRIDALRASGYTQIEGVFVDIPVEASLKRADARYRAAHDEYLAGNGLGGRFIPPQVITRQAEPEWGTKNRKVFEEIKHRFDSWSLYDNSVDGRKAVLKDSSKQDVAKDVEKVK